MFTRSVRDGACSAPSPRCCIAIATSGCLPCTPLLGLSQSLCGCVLFLRKYQSGTYPLLSSFKLRISAMPPSPRLSFRTQSRPCARPTSAHPVLARVSSAVSTARPPLSRACLATSPVVETVGKDVNEKEKKVFSGLDALTAGMCGTTHRSS